ncbi:MAG: SDR family oxidoreductase [Anaerolineales bacterium]|jgi:NAD(P)-dependent dehydrogenase (short-subunit alcohol dehydrogenase family)
MMSNLPQLFDLTGRSAVVTGGAGLLGRQFCQTLAAAGAAVSVVDINTSAAEMVAEAINQTGGRAVDIPTDITDPESVAAMVDSALEAFGRLDILVNSAALDPKFDPEGIADQGQNAFETFPLEGWQQAIDVNLTGMFLCTQAATQPMLAQGKGVVVNLCSMYGLVGPDQRLYQREGQPPQYKPVTYSVTKAGVLGMTQYLAAYYGAKNIRVNALTPGGVFNQHDEEFVKAYSARAVLGRMAEQDEMNGALLFLASDASSYMTGANLVVDGGWTAW